LLRRGAAAQRSAKHHNPQQAHKTDSPSPTISKRNQRARSMASFRGTAPCQSEALTGLRYHHHDSGR
jgi:hypothetical protein